MARYLTVVEFSFISILLFGVNFGGQPAQATYIVDPKILLIQAGNEGVATFKFNDSFIDFDCAFNCNGKGLSKNGIEKGPGMDLWHHCQYRFAADINTGRNCTATVIGSIIETETISESFYIPKAITVNSLPVVAQKAMDADFGVVHQKYTNPLECKFLIRNERYTQDNCRMIIHKTEIGDAGTHNFSICWKDTPDVCITSNKSVYVLSAKEDGSNLTIAINGASRTAELSIKCSDGCSHPEPEPFGLDNDGNWMATLHNVTDKSVIQVYQDGSILFNRTVGGMRMLNKKTTKNNTEVHIIIVAVVLGSIGFVAAVAVLICVRRKKFCFKDCFKEGNTDRESSSIPLKGMRPTDGADTD